MRRGDHSGGRGIPIYCPYWGRGCSWSVETTGETGRKLLERHLAGERNRGSAVHLKPEREEAK